MADLRELKRWIHKKKVEAREQREWADKAEAVQGQRYEQLAMNI
jgi:hypothetical protein